MSVKDFLANYRPGDDFDFEAFRAEALKEYDGDETAWRAAVSTRDETIRTTAADLQKAQAKAWELSQQQPVTPSTDGDEPDENDMDAIRARVFTPVSRK